MRDVKEILDELIRFADNPKACLDEVLAAGRKAVGVMPYYAPEELVYAAGMVPFGLWGADMAVSESRQYFPTFYCGIVHTILELGLTGKLSGLSAVMIPLTCDSLKGMGANWKYGVKTIPIIDVPYAQNRKIEAGKAFTTAKYKEILAKLTTISGKTVTDEDVLAAIRLFNENRAACMDFVRLAGKHTDVISALARSKVLKSRTFADRARHTALVRELNEALQKLPECTRGIPVVTTGILADSPELMNILDENGFVIAADQVAYESVELRYPVPEVPEDPVSGFALRLAETEGTSVLYDPGKKRAEDLKNLAKEAGADGVIWVGTKFCDPEEFDYVPVKNVLDEAGIPVLTIEVDRQMVNFEQIRTAAEAFKDAVG